MNKKGTRHIVGKGRKRVGKVKENYERHAV